MYFNDKLGEYGLIAYRVSKRERRINKVPIGISNKTRQKKITENTKKGEILTDKIDELLEEIDEVLEDAEEFVKNYVQKSGE